MLSLLIGACALRAQVNYVLNPGFEQYWRCPYRWDQTKYANYWSAVDSNWSTVDSIIYTHYPPFCAPDYYNTCSIDSYTRVPNNMDFYQYPRQGNGMMGAVMYFDSLYQGQSDQRDYIQGRFYKPLTAGKTYCIKFWVNLEEASQYAVNKIGAYLDDGKIDTITQDCGLPQTKYTPQVFSTAVITDNIGWTKIEGSFPANGTERFITIGNFFSKANTTAVSLSNPLRGPNNFAFYLIDDVSVIELNLAADAGPDRYITKGDSTFIGRTPEVGLDCKWYRNGVLIDSGAGIWVKPQVTTSYVVEQTICGLVKKDTVKVEVWPVGIKELSVSGGLTLFPNPSSDGTITLRQSGTEDRQVMVSITNSYGRQVYGQMVRFSGKEAVVRPGRLPAGMYWVRVEGGRGDTSAPLILRFVVE